MLVFAKDKSSKFDFLKYQKKDVNISFRSNCGSMDNFVQP